MKHKNLNILSIPLLLIVLTTFFSSCVSQKKYNAALDEIARLNVDSTFQEYQITDIKYRQGNIIYDQKQEIINQMSKSIKKEQE